jgi:hypothetical protein
MEQIIQAQKEVLKSYDTALISKASTYKELLPDVQRYQKAIAEGNT